MISHGGTVCVIDSWREYRGLSIVGERYTCRGGPNRDKGNSASALNRSNIEISTLTS